MREHQPRGMQKWPLEMFERAQIAGHVTPRTSVQSVADNRVPNRAQVHANLMGTSRRDGNMKKRDSTQTLSPRHPRYR
jgi:predicted nucleotidyltransferase